MKIDILVTKYQVLTFLPSLETWSGIAYDETEATVTNDPSQ